MAVLESCPKYNMVAYLEKTAGNAEFHEVIDFLARSSIHNALTVSPVVFTTFVKQFWMSAKSKIINNVSYITAKVAGKPVSISEASIRSDLLFDDADGIDSLPNQAIFDAIQLMGYEGDLTVLTFNKALFSPQWRFLFHTMNHCISSKSTSWDQIPTNIATATDPSSRPSPSIHIPDSIPESFGGNHEGQSSSDKSLSGNEGEMTLQSVYDLYISLCTQVTDQANEIKHLKAHIKRLKKKAKPGRKSAKAEPSVHKDPLFDELPDDTLDYIDTKDAQDVERTRDVVYEEKKTANDKVSTEDALSTDKEKVCIDRLNVITNRPKVSIDKEKDSTIRPDEVLLNMSQAKVVSRKEEKGVELKDVEDTERPRPTSTRSLLTLKPLPKIDPKDKGKKKIEEENESMKTGKQNLMKFEEIQALYEKIRGGSKEEESTRKKENWYLEKAEVKEKKNFRQNTLRMIEVFPIKDGKLSILELNHRYQDEIPEGFDRVLWGDLMIMFNPDYEDKFWNSQQDWNIVSWKLHGSSGVHTLMTKAGLVIHMLVEKKYPLRKKFCCNVGIKVWSLKMTVLWIRVD
ncbi:hypothetical protein Tco_1268339 [Tanacetum coccineum]